MAETITIRELVPSDVEPVLDLLKVSLGESDLLQRTPELFAWKHFDNPFGQSICLVATYGERIVGLRAFMRWDLRTPAGATLRCVRAVDTATHPDFQRRGIFRRLTEEAVAMATARGIDLIFNTPNPRSGSGYLSMGWIEVGPIGVLVRPTTRLPGAWRKGKNPAPGLRESDVPNWTRAPLDRPALGLRTPRTKEYLDWRFRSHPTAHYRMVDYGGAQAVVRPNVRNGRRELLVVDLFGRNQHRVVRRAASVSKAPYLAAWFTSGTPERAACRRAGLWQIPGLTTLTLMARPLHELDADVSSPEAWDFALSDLELL